MVKKRPNQVNKTSKVSLLLNQLEGLGMFRKLPGNVSVTKHNFLKSGTFVSYWLQLKCKLQNIGKAIFFSYWQKESFFALVALLLWNTLPHGPILSVVQKICKRTLFSNTF